MTPTARPFALTDEQQAAFVALANQQRGEPEQAMLRVQRLVHGVLSYAVEHAGDINHRMNERAALHSQHPGGYTKVADVLRKLRDPLDFHLEHIRNVESAAKRSGQSFSVYYDKVKAALHVYGRAHAALPVYTRGQQLAQNVCVALGGMQWKDAILALQEMKRWIDAGQDEWRYLAWGIPPVEQRPRTENPAKEKSARVCVECGVARTRRRDQEGDPVCRRCAAELAHPHTPSGVPRDVLLWWTRGPVGGRGEGEAEGTAYGEG